MTSRQPSEEEPEAPPLPTPETAPKPLLELGEPLPEVTGSTAALERVGAALRAGAGPVAIDAERASGFRYSQRAYLIQLRRAGAGTALIDPILIDDFGPLATALRGTEWVLHAASQDLPCLTALGLRPDRLFDTELAARLLNFHRVGLARLVEELLGARLAKQHSAVDWSTRPLPTSWLEYAALDVEVLLELRGLLADRLQQAGKQHWAAEEFDALTRFTPPERRPDPWRRTSGVHRLPTRRSLAIVRELWEARDTLAAQLDVAPGRLLTDAAIVEAAAAAPRDLQAARALPGMRHRQARRHVETWAAAIERAAALPEAQLPSTTSPAEALPPPRSWPERNPAAAARLQAVRAVVAELCDRHDLPAENLLTPESVRRLAWAPPEPLGPATVAEALRRLGARDWQIGLTAEPFAAALATRRKGGADTRATTR